MEVTEALPANGIITLSVPQWFGTLEYMENPVCTSVMVGDFSLMIKNMGTSMTCTYAALSNMLTVDKAVSVDTTTKMQFKVTNFKNPLSVGS
jgi:hypothetical protein